MTASDRLSFTGASGVRLQARLDRPAQGRPRATALFAHCFTCSKEAFAAARISSALAERGIAVLRFDFTGLGGSEGDFANTNFSSNVADLLAAVAYLRDLGQAPSLLIGHSLGGAAVLAAAPGVPEARAVVTLNAPCSPAHVLKLLREDCAEIERDGAAEVELGGRTFTITRQFVEDISEQRLLQGVHDMRKALLVFHAPRDAIVGVENAAKLFQAALHPKSFVSLDDADHLLTRRADAVYAADVIAAWAGRYLAADVETPLAAEPLESGTVLVEEASTGRFAQNVTVGRHRLTADEPVSLGGNDSGPGPYDYLLTALGACTAMTLRMYAARKNLPLDHVAVSLRHTRIHAADCGDCETREGKIDRIEREVELVGNLDEDTRARLLEIADKCPVHRTLHSETVIHTRLRD